MFTNDSISYRQESWEEFSGPWISKTRLQDLERKRPSDAEAAGKFFRPHPFSLGPRPEIHW